MDLWTCWTARFLRAIFDPLYKYKFWHLHNSINCIIVFIRVLWVWRYLCFNYIWQVSRKPLLKCSACKASVGPPTMTAFTSISDGHFHLILVWVCDRAPMSWAAASPCSLFSHRMCWDTVAATCDSWIQAKWMLFVEFLGCLSCFLGLPSPIQKLLVTPEMQVS